MEPFCNNSRKYILFFDIFGVPKTCPYRDEIICIGKKCGYYEEKEPSKYFKRKLEGINHIGEEK